MHAGLAPEPEPIAIACSLDSAGLAERVAEFERLFAITLQSYERQPAQLKLVLAGSAVDEEAIRDLFQRENECCQFFAFAISREVNTVVVIMGVPAGAEPMLDGFEALAAARSVSATPMPA